MEEKLLKIINYYKILPQLKYFQSEVYELNEAIIQYEERERNPIDIVLNSLEPIIALLNNRKVISSTNAIKEEIADVLVMLEQFRNYYDISLDEIKKVMEYKIDRQLERIESENKEDLETVKKVNDFMKMFRNYYDIKKG